MATTRTTTKSSPGNSETTRERPSRERVVVEKMADIIIRKREKVLRTLEKR